MADSEGTACVFDVFEYNGGLDGWCSQPVIKANAGSETYAIRVTGTPWSIDLRVNDVFDETDAATVVGEIEKAIKNSFSPRAMCPRTNCTCGKSSKNAQNFSTCPCVLTQRMVFSKTTTTNGYEFFTAFPYNGFQRTKSRFLRVYLKQAYFSSIAKRVMVNFVKSHDMGVECEVYGFENDTVLHFVDVSARLSNATPKRETIRSDAWITFPTTRRVTKRITRCDHEFEVRFDELRVVSAPPVLVTPRVLCYDIETDTDGISFSKPERNPVLSITLYLMTNRFESVLITHGKPAPFVGIQINTRSERETLIEFRKRVLAFKPDVISGHNIQGFDINYLHKRAEILTKTDSKTDDVECIRAEQLANFRDYSFLIDYNVRTFECVRHKGGKKTKGAKNTKPGHGAKRKEQKSKPGSANTVVYVDCPGVWVCDTVNVSREREALENNKLDTVAREVLDDRKIEFPVTQIRAYFNGTDKMRQLLYMYNMRDSAIVGRLLVKWDAINSCMKEAHMFGCLVRHLHVMGKQNKLLRLFRAFGEAQGVAIPKHESVTETEYDAIENDLECDSDSDDEEDDRRQLIPFLLGYKSAVDYSGTYEGAFVFEPQIGFHKAPVVVLDFNSLYPNVMRARNLCSTVHLKTTKNVLEDPAHLVEVCAKHGLTTDDVFVSPNGDVFVKSHVKRGLGPLMMDYMLDKRAECKAEIKAAKAAKNEANEKNAEAKSNSFKVGANSFYGGTGSRLSPFYDPGVSASITKLGQNAIKAMDEFVGGTKGKSWEYGTNKFTTRRIYGDTDSLMIRLDDSDLVSDGVFDAKRAWEILEWLAATVNHHGHSNNIFPSNMKMGADKVFSVYLLEKKKRYAGVLHEQGKPKPKVKISGLEAEKREYPEVLRRTMRTVLDMALRSVDAQEIYDYVEMRTRNLLSAELVPDVSDELFMKMVENWDGTEENLPELPDVGESLRVSDFMISVAIKAESDYDNPMGTPQFRAAKIWQTEKGVDAAPKPGDRILFGYALLLDSKTKSASEAARPAYRFLEGTDTIDRMYYFENKYKSPLENVLNLILGESQTKQVLDPSRYRRLIGVTKIPAINGPRTNEVRQVFQAPSKAKRTYAVATKNRSMDEFMKRAKAEAEVIKRELGA